MRKLTKKEIHILINQEIFFLFNRINLRCPSNGISVPSIKSYTETILNYCNEYTQLNEQEI